jgi:S-formylglutathione hydrolase FrmB
MSTSDPQIPLPPDILRQLAVPADWLATWWPAAVCAVLGVVLVVAVRRVGGARRRWPAVTGAVLALVLACGFAANTALAYVSNVSAAWQLVSGQVVPQLTAGAGKIEAHSIASPARLGMPAATTWVYTPPGYDPAGTVRYPVVYLLHGTPGRSADWITSGKGNIAHVMDVLIADHFIRPMIVVAPDVNGRDRADAECLDSTRGGSQVETYLSTVVVPWVDHHYATRTDWAHRVIGGMSSGGFCALDQGLRHPELYGSIVALEPYDNPGSGGRAMLATRAQYDAHSPGRYLPTMAFTHPVPTFLDIGSIASGDGAEIATTAAQLRARGQTVSTRIEPNLVHGWEMANAGIVYGLAFVSGQMPA